MDYAESLDLIEKFKAYPCLWDKNNPWYRVRKKREEAWSDIELYFNKPGVNLKYKMQCLKGTYRRIKKREQEKAAANGEFYSSNWFAYKSFGFLDDKYDPSESIPGTSSPLLSVGANAEDISEFLMSLQHEDVEEGDVGQDAEKGGQEKELVKNKSFGFLDDNYDPSESIPGTSSPLLSVGANAEDISEFLMTLQHEDVEEGDVGQDAEKGGQEKELEVKEEMEEEAVEEVKEEEMEGEIKEEDEMDEKEMEEENEEDTDEMDESVMEEEENEEDEEDTDEMDESVMEEEENEEDEEDTEEMDDAVMEEEESKEVEVEEDTEEMEMVEEENEEETEGMVETVLKEKKMEEENEENTEEEENEEGKVEMEGDKQSHVEQEENEVAFPTSSTVDDEPEMVLLRSLEMLISNNIFVDSNFYFGQCVATKLRTFDSITTERVKNSIIEVLVKADMGLLFPSQTPP